jgi:uncharacterized protein (DUF433 family)
MQTDRLSEAEKMQKVQGIVFADGPAGRRARVAGTGLEVFEIIDALRSCHGDREALAKAFESLRPEQLQAAYDYYATFPEEIDAWLEEAANITPGYLHANFPQPQRTPRTTRTR